jgi:5-methylcytosine-specific restriction endonuclease McrA
VPTTEQPAAIRFAERVLQMLDDGRFTATHKFAVLLALMDLCLESTEASGAPPTMITTAQLADKVVEIYWSHTLPFHSQRGTSVLRQNTTGQAEILSLIAMFRERYAPDPSTPRWGARLHAPEPYQRLVREVEWKLIEMPLPRLQVIGGVHVPVLYEISWDSTIRRRDVADYQRGAASVFSNAVTLLPGVGEHLLQLNMLLRPLVQRLWSDLVARVNRLEESQLDIHLFGCSRVPTAPVRRGLWEWQERRCFYCAGRIGDPAMAHVDHFVPWARYPDDSLDNLVVADARCNSQKNAALAASEHLARWARRLDVRSADHDAVAELALALRWEHQPQKSLGVARAIYFRLPADARLWVRGQQFTMPDEALIQAALRAPSRPEADNPSA